MADTSTFELTVAGESVSVENVIAAWQNLSLLLSSVERAVAGENYAPGRWRADHDPTIKLTASVNGLNKEQLDEIAEKATDGLVIGSRSGHFPEEFRAEAIRGAKKVLSLLRDAEALTINTETQSEVITMVTLEGEGQEQIFGQKPRRKVYAAIEGVLSRLWVGGKDGYTAAIKDRFTNATVKFSVTDEHLETIKGLLHKDKVVVAEGVVIFDGDTPLRFHEMTSIKESVRNTPLLSFVGVLPALPNGETAEDFLERLNNGDSPS